MNNKKSRKIKESPEWKWYQERLDTVHEYRRSCYENMILKSMIDNDEDGLNAIRDILQKSWDYYHENQMEFQSEEPKNSRYYGGKLLFE